VSPPARATPRTTAPPPPSDDAQPSETAPCRPRRQRHHHQGDRRPAARIVQVSHVHMLAWRDLDDDEAGGSEIHAHNIASIWAQSGLGVTMRTSAAVGRPTSAVRDGYTVSRKAGRYGVFPVPRCRSSPGGSGPATGWSRSGTACPSSRRCGGGAPGDLAAPRARPDVGHDPARARRPVRRGARGADRADGSTGTSRSSRCRRRRATSWSTTSASTPSGHGRPEPGVDPFFTPGGDRSPVPLAVAVGRLVPVKDFPRLVRVMARARERVPDAAAGDRRRGLRA
jgi:hypothetical protein